MCGFIAAFSSRSLEDQNFDRSLEILSRRGPDGEGIWTEDGVFLGHRRLAIIDLDDRASQPMHSACGRYSLVFNGEIYNYKELRKELVKTGRSLKTNSDTEVVLELFALYGEESICKLSGMFSFVIWDKYQKKAFAVRDPYGIKPLYYALFKDGIIFSSQVKAILMTDLVARKPNLIGQMGFWLTGSVPEPHTWYEDIKSLKAGHLMWTNKNKIIVSKCWQNIGDAWRNAEPNYNQTEQEVQEVVTKAVEASINRHIVADVPLGIFLSGGIDSGVVAAIISQKFKMKIKGITIAYNDFKGKHQDESPTASLLANYYDIDHHIRYVDKEEFLNDLPHIFHAMDQPSIDGINTWYASKALSEQGLKVVLSGIGGDELFFGYNTFKQLPPLVNFWKNFYKIPFARPSSVFLSKIIAYYSNNRRWLDAPNFLSTIYGGWMLRRGINSIDEAFQLLGDNINISPSDFELDEWFFDNVGDIASNNMLAIAQLESCMYLKNQLLRDSDWASMFHGVELRTPLVDFQLLKELSSSLLEISRFSNKSLLSNAPFNPLPINIQKRSKTGFSIPVQKWLKEIYPHKDLEYKNFWNKRIVEEYERF